MLEAAFNHARPSYPQLVASAGWLRWWVEHGLIPVPAAAAAATLFAVGLTIGGHREGRSLTSLPQMRLEALSETLWPAGEPSYGRVAKMAALYLPAIALTAFVVRELPGGVLACYGPAAAAIVLPWQVRRRRVRRRAYRLRRPTVAGYQPSYRALLPLRRWIALENLDKAYPVASVVTTNFADTAMDDTAHVFRSKGDPRSEAYCLARGIEYLLARNSVAEAEARSRAAIEDDRLSRRRRSWRRGRSFWR